MTSSEQTAKANLVIRPATPDDAEAAAKLIHLSGPEIYTNMLGGDRETALRILQTIFATPRTLISHDNALVVQIDDNIVGLLICYDKQTEKDQGLRFFNQVRRALPFGRFIKALFYMLGMWHMVRRMKNDSWFGGVIAVAPDKQGTRVGLALLDAMREQAENRGLPQLEADVETDNDHAMHIYLKYGWVITGKRRSGVLRRLLKFDGYYRIELKLR